MPQQTSIFKSPEPKYCLDTNIVFSFWNLTAYEPYGKDVFKSHWNFIDENVKEGIIVAPDSVGHELKKSKDKKLLKWLKSIPNFLVEIDQNQITAMRPIVNQYPIYGQNSNYYGDLCVVALAKTKGLIVVTAEIRKSNPSKTTPKIPNLCDSFGVECISLIELFRKENVSI